MLKTRVITALVLLSVLLPIILFGPFSVFNALITLVVIFSTFEWVRLLGFRNLIGSIMYTVIVVIILNLTMRLGIESNTSHPLFVAAGIFWMVISPLALWYRPALTRCAWRLFLLAAGAILLIAFWHAIVIARLFGSKFILSLLLVVWIVDISAYFFGKFFGKHKLLLSISPGKTLEGAIGSFIAVTIFSGAAMTTHLFEPNLFSVLVSRYQILGAWVALMLLTTFSIVGDLFESMLKRQVGFKDSSGILPGHGGILDRIDSLLPVLPLVMLLL
ncbi:MAG: phosphatidate cytidylyltransferase [Burkholderia sp.]|nr:phosphatidate cytidylyltransferase [Burkholderia sp.]